MSKVFGRDLTSGSVPKNMITFALPVLTASVLNAAYAVVNAIWVGRLLGREAVGAVAVSFPVFLILVALASGTTMACSILVSRNYGAKDLNGIQKVVNVSWSVGFLIIGIVSIGGVLLSDSILRLLGTPNEIMGLASSYLKITIIGFIFMYLNYLIISTLRGIGNTVTPMCFILISTLVNAILDPVLIKGIGIFPELGLNGAALASVLAGGCASVFGFVYMRIKYKEMPINFKRLDLDKKLVPLVLKIGLPSFFQQSVLSLSYAFVTYFVNGFGPTPIAAFGITSRIDTMVAMPALSLMTAASTLTAQSIGAGKLEKTKEIFKWGVIIAVPVYIVLSSTFILFSKGIMGIFIDNTEVISAGTSYFGIVAFGYLCMSVFYISNGIVNGAGKTIATMIISFVTLCLVRIPFTAVLSKTALEIKGIWLAITLSMLATMICSFSYYKFGNWKKAESENSNNIVLSKKSTGIA